MFHEGLSSGWRGSGARADRRYPVRNALQYRSPGRAAPAFGGSGWTVDLSASGVLFESEEALPAGVEVEVEICWPAGARSVWERGLWARGRTVRREGNRTAVAFVRHEFRGPCWSPDRSTV